MAIFTILDHCRPFWTISDHFDHFLPFWTIWDHFGPFKTILTIFDHFLRVFSGRFDTSGSMIPRLVPEISPLDAFCDAAVVAGIGDSRSWI